MNLVINDNSSLKDARDWLRQRVDDGETCPCCKQFAKVYPRMIYGKMAAALIRLHAVSRPDFSFVHVSKIDVPTIRSVVFSGDFAKLALWELIEPMPKDEKDKTKRANGSWRITQRGIDFVNGKITVPKYVKIYDGRRIGFDDSEMVSIQNCLGEKFDYAELMGRSNGNE